MIDTQEQLVDRFYRLLFQELHNTIPHFSKPIHIYSKGDMLRGFQVRKTMNGWQLDISRGIDYGASALGFKADGSRRSPRGKLERLNFKVLENAIRKVQRLIGANNLGLEVYMNGKRIVIV